MLKTRLVQWTLILVSMLTSPRVLGEDAKDFAKPTPGVTKEAFGQTPDGQVVDLFTLTSETGIEVQVMTFGATLISIRTPDRDGNFENIVLRLDTFDDYYRGHPAMGSTIGRFANRIGGGGFTIDGTRYDLESCNQHGVQLHGGRTGWGRQIWQARANEDAPDPTVVFSISSPDGHEGFPGHVEASATFILAENKLTIEYRATTDQPTHVNMTNHAYFNLAGAGNGHVLDHVVHISADRYLELDAHQVPTGQILPVNETPLDFRQPHTIGERIRQLPGGYDHCYVLYGETPVEWDMAQAAKVTDPGSGRTLEVWTDQPGVQFFTANGLSDRYSWRGKKYGPHHGFCLETQHFPDSPNKPEFPSTLLRPIAEPKQGRPLRRYEWYLQNAIFAFGVDNHR